ncbi:hypothetical protein CCICO_09700 [Corynebacterium ciconiae DSM 44920]|uniref:DUF3073 domain-containing protein n=1 Tax=Corynebacterium ciconiae TaxID=227319 RepID=UPI00037939B9|nr:DUF3073 domain-containing protein [Corynebacterium ciconiae]WKD61939.1 hypothetical protein CCICO_09700 [Corynebacterium ciconiae DSM 44920]
MGRGRAKAKQAKVARQLKYHTPDMDLEQLQRELASNSSRSEEDVREDDLYSEWADYFEDEDEK